MRGGSRCGGWREQGVGAKPEWYPALHSYEVQPAASQPPNIGCHSHSVGLLAWWLSLSLSHSLSLTLSYPVRLLADGLYRPRLRLTKTQGTRK